MSQYHFDTITLDTFKDVLARYPSTVPENIRDLDTLRYTTIPFEAITKDGSAHLTKDRVEKLVEWKLYFSLSIPRVIDSCVQY